MKPEPLTIAEGRYSLRPDLREGYHLRVWLEASWAMRRQRLLERGGSEGLAQFETTWIPLEDQYFKTCRAKECYHFVLFNNNIKTDVIRNSSLRMASASSL